MRFSKWHSQIAFVRPAHPERLLHAPRPTERALGSTQPLTVCLRSDQAVPRIDVGDLIYPHFIQSAVSEDRTETTKVLCLR